MGLRYRFICVIPARYKSSRFPGKPLADINGRPLIWWVYQQAIKISQFNKVIVATDDLRIKKSCKNLGLNVMMTSQDHPTGTDRVSEIAKKLDADIYVNIQGDEPLIRPKMIIKIISYFSKKDRSCDVANLMTRIIRHTDLMDSTVPKVAVNRDKKAIFLSRLPIPYPKNPLLNRYYKQVCIYGYTREMLLKFCTLPRGYLEQAEDIELLRFIENQIPVQMLEVEGDTVAVDTPYDLKLISQILAKKI